MKVKSTNQAALKNAVMRTYAARFIADDRREKEEDLRETLLEDTSEVYLTGNQTSQRRSECLGVDRYGVKYWIFGAQASFPISSFANAEPRGNEAHFDGPSFLIKSPAGLWKVTLTLTLTLIPNT